MKTTKRLLLGLLVLGVMSCASYGQVTSDDLLSLLGGDSSTTSTSDLATSLTSSSGIMSSIIQYMDPTQLQDFLTAFMADQNGSNPSTTEGFLLNYLLEHPEFQTSLNVALQKIKEKNKDVTEADLQEGLLDQLSNLQKKIDENDNLTDKEKDEYKALLKKYQDMADNMQNQITNTNNAINNALSKAAQPQKMDPAMSALLIMMGIAMLLKVLGGGGGGGGGGCGGGGCGG